MYSIFVDEKLRMKLEMQAVTCAMLDYCLLLSSDDASFNLEWPSSADSKYLVDVMKICCLLLPV